LGLCTVIVFFSLAGVPPLAGFFAKMEIFLGALGSSLFLTSIIAILTSVISAFFYVRLVKIMFFEKTKNNLFIFPLTQACSIILGFVLFALIFFAINPTLLLLFTQKMALCLFIR
jgi:NADH-quinone oxidoreductase subunit N